MLTYKNIKTIIEQFATSHAQIRENHRGNIYDIDEIKQVDGAYLVWNINGLVSNGVNGANWSMTMFFMSQVSEVNSIANTESVKNECSLMAMDFVSFLAKYNYGLFTADRDYSIEFNKEWNIELFEERFNSLYAGAELNVSLIGQFDYDRCAIPAFIETPALISLITEDGMMLITEDSNQLITE